MANRSRRILKEMDDLRKDPASGMAANLLNENDISHLRGSFKGPPQTPYEGGTYYVDIKIPQDYPFRPPQMKFETKVYHPNISSQTGAICLDTLGQAWSPVLTIKSALLSLQSLLSTPEPKDPQDAEVAGIMIRNPQQFQRTAREWAVRYAGAPDTATPMDILDTPATRQPLNNGGANAVERARRAREEEAAKYEGYKRPLVDNFCSMGFDVPRVVGVLRSLAVPKSLNHMPPEIAEEVVERLLTSA